MLKWIIPLFIGFFLFWLLGFLTGEKSYGSKDDEGYQYMKQKAIVRSWLLLIVFLFINFVFDLFKLKDERLALLNFEYPELFYLILALVTYFIYYLLYQKRMTSSEK